MKNQYFFSAISATHGVHLPYLVMLFVLLAIYITGCSPSPAIDDIRMGVNMIPTPHEPTDTAIPLDENEEGLNTSLATGSGPLVGGIIGPSSDSADNANVLMALDNNPTYKASHWTNAQTGVKYTVTPTSNVIAVKGNTTCRRFRSVIVINNKTQHIYGTACKQPDGNYEAIRL